MYSSLQQISHDSYMYLLQYAIRRLARINSAQKVEVILGKELAYFLYLFTYTKAIEILLELDASLCQQVAPRVILMTAESGPPWCHYPEFTRHH